MSKVTDLATFQFTTQQTNQPISTAEVNASDAQATLSRMDSPHEPTTRTKRAAQLKEFTNWLAKRQQPAHHDPATFVSQPLEIVADNSKNFRVDTATQQATELRYQSPHFDTRNYVEAVEVDNSRQPITITDGFDPEIGSVAKQNTPPAIESAVNALKADGRVLGDSEQLTSERNLIVPAFRWSEVSNNLLGSPAMLNLETNVRQSLQTYRTQIVCLLYTSPSPRDATLSRMPSSA